MPPAYIESISIPKKTTNLLLIKARAYDNTQATQKVLSLIKQLKAIQDEDINAYITLQQKNISHHKQDINITTAAIKSAKEKSAHYQQQLFKIEKNNAALAGIYAIELGKMQTDLNVLNERRSKLNSEQNDLLFSISESNIKRTAVVGKIETSNRPVKPKKKLIVVVAFITGLMLSIFLAFFLEFVQGFKQEESEIKK